MNLAQHDTDFRAGVVEQVSDTCHDVNTALSTIVLCIDFLAEQSQTVGHEAVQDARIAVRRVSVVMASLRDSLEPEESRAKTSAVFRRSDPPGADSGRSRTQTT
jgi:hypothetical protein